MRGQLNLYVLKTLAPRLRRAAALETLRTGTSISMGRLAERILFKGLEHIEARQERELDPARIAEVDTYLHTRAQLHGTPHALS